MKLSLVNILGYRLHAVDGDVARVEDFLFDDFNWLGRYLVAGTGRSGSRPGVLVPVTDVAAPTEQERVLSISWTAAQVLDGPDIHADLPVSLQRAKSCGGGDVFADPGWVAAGGRRIQGDPCLRSVAGVVGYALQTTEGEVGHVEDFIVETGDWRVSFMIVDTGGWLPGRKVLLSTERITRIDFVNAKVSVDMDRSGVEDGPEYDPDTPANCDEGAGFLDYLGRRVR